MVAIYHVARVIQIVDYAFLGHLLVAVVAFEQSERLLAVLHLNYEFTVHHLRHAVAVLVNDVYVILRIRHSHCARFWFHPGVCAHHHGGLRLSVRLVYRYARLCLPLIKHAGVESLASRGAPPECGEVVGTDVLTYEKTVYGRRCAERCDVIVLQHAQQHLGVEASLVVIYEDRSPA